MDVGYADYRKILEMFTSMLESKFGKELISVILYGSVCRNEAKKESDVDILIILRNPSESYYERLLPVIEVEKKLGESTEYKKLVSWGFYPQLSYFILSEKEARKNRYIYLDMIEDSIILFDRENFFKEKLEELKARLRELGSRKILLPDGTWYWDLKPDLKLGEEFEL